MQERKRNDKDRERQTEQCESVKGTEKRKGEKLSINNLLPIYWNRMVPLFSIWEWNIRSA